MTFTTVQFSICSLLALNYTIIGLISYLRIHTYMTLYIIYIFIYLSTGFKTGSLPSCCCIMSKHMYSSVLHKMTPFYMNISMRESAAHPPPLRPFKNDLDLIIHINKKINIKIFRGSKFICTCTLYYVPAVYKNNATPILPTT